MIDGGQAKVKDNSWRLRKKSACGVLSPVWPERAGKCEFQKGKN